MSILRRKKLLKSEWYIYRAIPPYVSLQLNTKKTKILVFNKSGKVLKGYIFTDYRGTRKQNIEKNKFIVDFQ